MDFQDVEIRKSKVKQFEDGLGVFAKREFKNGEIVIKWNLKVLTKEEYQRIPEYERTNFTHKRNGVIYLYPDPERHVNRSRNPNVIPDFKNNANVALRDIRDGEEITIPDTSVEDF